MLLPSSQHWLPLWSQWSHGSPPPTRPTPAARSERSRSSCSPIVCALSCCWREPATKPHTSRSWRRKPGPARPPLEKAARSSAIQDALALAASEPLGAAGLAYDAMRLTSQALELENRHLASDLGCAAEFAAAALAASAYNVRVNHAYLRDLDTVRAQELQLAQLEARAATELAAIRQALRPAP